MGNLKTNSAGYGQLMSCLMKERSRFTSEEEFKSYAVAEVRRFIADLRSVNLELTLRPTYNGTPLSHHSATEKLAEN